MGRDTAAPSIDNIESLEAKWLGLVPLRMVLMVERSTPGLSSVCLPCPLSALPAPGFLLYAPVPVTAALLAPPVWSLCHPRCPPLPPGFDAAEINEALPRASDGRGRGRGGGDHSAQYPVGRRAPRVSGAGETAARARLQAWINEDPDSDSEDFEVLPSAGLQAQSVSRSQRFNKDPFFFVQ